MSLAESTTAWSVEDRLERRRTAALRRIDRRAVETIRRRRGWRRDMARAALAVALIVLGFLCVEMGRKAVTLLAVVHVGMGGGLPGVG